MYLCQATLCSYHAPLPDGGGSHDRFSLLDRPDVLCLRKRSRRHLRKLLYALRTFCQYRTFSKFARPYTPKNLENDAGLPNLFGKPAPCPNKLGTPQHRTPELVRGSHDLPQQVGGSRTSDSRTSDSRTCSGNPRPAPTSWGLPNVGLPNLFGEATTCPNKLGTPQHRTPELVRESHHLPQHSELYPCSPGDLTGRAFCANI